MQIKYEVGDQVQYQPDPYGFSGVNGEIKELRGDYCQVEMAGGRVQLVPRRHLIPLESTIKNARML